MQVATKVVTGELSPLIPQNAPLHVQQMMKKCFEVSLNESVQMSIQRVAEDRLDFQAILKILSQ